MGVKPQPAKTITNSNVLLLPNQDQTKLEQGQTPCFHCSIFCHTTKEIMMKKFAAMILLLLPFIGTSYAGSDIPDSVCEEACSSDYSGVEQKICSFMCKMGPAFAVTEKRPISTDDCPDLVQKVEHRKVCRTGVRTYLNYTKANTPEAAQPLSITLTKVPDPTEDVQKAAQRAAQQERAAPKDIVCKDPYPILKNGMCHARPTPKSKPRSPSSGNAVDR